MATKIIPVPKTVKNDLTGQRFGRWTVVGYVGDDGTRSANSMWLCRCDCGREEPVRGTNITSGRSLGCGCNRVRHGMHKTPEYEAWANMLSRCTNPRHRAYPSYGGRGIKVCDQWAESFQAFYQDMGPRPGSAYSLDRIDNDGDYHPANCRWAAQKTQSNNRRSNHPVTFNGQTYTISQWSRKLGISRSTLNNRLADGWSIERALTTPAGNTKTQAVH